MGAEQGRFTLAELAAASGVSPRTIRYYTTEGLLPPPGERGRYAIYTGVHLRRLQLIGQLKAAYLPLAAIRERLAARSDDARLPDDGGWPDDTKILSSQASTDRQLPPPLTHEPASASGFGFRVSASLAAGPTDRASAVRPPAQPTPTGYAALFPYPDEAMATEGTTIESGELWQRVPLGPGVELHVRAPVSVELQQRLDRLIADARALLNDES